ncbi:hypothetical protein [Gayadomonas joobiniege]|uniref:hypothetical protein n=1 Tax=Gayadomonas joobiniege TaxID=1234606 RepID=UPI00037FA3ED|nr:hypothetical protein [Gayadomonas joobiniege]
MNEYFLEFSFEDGIIILENDGYSAWGYLLNPNSRELQKDVFLYSPRPPEPLIDREYIKNGNPPKLCEEYAAEGSFKSDIKESSLSVVSSGLGDYCILIDNEPIAAIYSNKNRGYSKSLIKSGGYGIPWCNKKYTAVFT